MPAVLFQRVFMIPNITIFDKEISSYMLFALAGILVTLWFIYRTAKKHGLNELDAFNVLLFCFAGGFIGAHILYGLVNFPVILQVIRQWEQIQSFSHFLRLFQVIFGGAVWYGGFLGGLLTGWLCLRHKKCLTPAYTDLLTLAVPLFHAFGRLGCFFSGCCYGVESEIGFVYHYSLIEEANGVSRFPVQLAEAALNLLLFGLLYFCYRRQKAQGHLLTLYLLSYSCYRFILEFFRGDAYRGIFGGLSTSQWISLALFGIALLYGFLSLRNRNKASPSPTE